MKLFGTDGIRGTINSAPMTSYIIQKVAMACVTYLQSHNKNNNQKLTIVIGKDTRISGYMVEAALASGFLSMGADVRFVGPLPTPAVAMLTPSMRANLGVMISASHNPYYDNGIKFFDENGFKLASSAELEIEQLVAHNNFKPCSPTQMGKAKRIEDAVGRYVESVKATLPQKLRLDGLKIVVDCAHGAAYKVAPTILWELGAEVITIGCEPDGININDGYGATAPEALQMAVIEYQAHLGIALDGDADRLIVVDELGQIIDGDQILAIIAKQWFEQGLIKGGAIVGTQMTNLGLEYFLKDLGLNLIRAQVGDKHVLAQMELNNCNIGGEQSGHIILSDFSSTGDGIIAALQILALLVKSDKPASCLVNAFVPIPQIIKNIVIPNGFDLNSPLFCLALEQAQQTLGCINGDGQIVVRKSGTEPLIRIMAQHQNRNLVDKIINDLACSINAA